jgi:protein-disulfide isomerase
MSRLTPWPGANDHVQGPLDAAVVLVEYGDFECPYCGEEYPELRAVQKAMGDSLCFVFRHFPLRQAHPHAEHAAEFSEAAATVDKFWEMHDLLYENQQALSDRDLVRYSRSLGLEEPLIESAQSGTFAARVQRDVSSGARSGVNGTPCLFINGQRYDGLRDAKSLLLLLRQASQQS